MKLLPTLFALLPACAGLSSAPGAAHARPAPLAMLLTPPEEALIAAASAPSWGMPPPAPAFPLLPLWTLGLPPTAFLDPSLRLTDWRNAFDTAALGAFDVPLRDDPAERQNILLSAQAVDNVILPPGAEFSFNALVGERTPARGYQEGLMFDNGHVIRGTGGGICLVATGLYNAALHAGLTIDERHPHSGLVGYAPPGCDAGIVYGQEDLRFRNTTTRALTIQARPVDDDHVAVRLFGHRPPAGHQVIVKPLSLDRIAPSVITTLDPALLPGQKVIDQKPRAGYDVTLARFWTVKGRVVRREIVTRERRAPRPEIVRIAMPVPVAPPVAPPVSVTIPTPGPLGRAGATSPGAPRYPLLQKGEGQSKTSPITSDSLPLPKERAGVRSLPPPAPSEAHP